MANAIAPHPPPGDVHIAVPEPGWVEQAAWAGEIATGIGTIALLAVAVVAAVWTKRQVMTALAANAHAAKQSKATFLLELDRRWEAPELSTARQSFRELQRGAEAHMETCKHRDPDGRQAELKEYYSRTLYDMMKQQLPSYISLMAICGFWETMGYLVNKDYLDLEDIVGLFGGAVIMFDDAFRVHLQHRANEEGVPDGFFEHALFLADAVRRRMGLT